jgi:hypothetical protein
MAIVDPFESSRRKIAWAKKNLTDLKREVAAWSSEKTIYEAFTELDPNKPDHITHKIRLTKQMPDHWCDLAGTVVDSLRAALDHATYDVAVASGCSEPRNAYFPFSGDITRFEVNLKGRCADVPKDIFPLLRAFEPYKGGSEALWALNEIRVANNHIPVIPIGTVTRSTGVNIRGTGFVEMPVTPIWDSTKNEMILFTLGPGATFQGQFDFAFYIAFGEIESVKGKPVIPILDDFVEIVETILGAIEAECRRLGFTM